MTAVEYLEFWFKNYGKGLDHTSFHKGAQALMEFDTLRLRKEPVRVQFKMDVSIPQPQPDWSFAATEYDECEVEVTADVIEGEVSGLIMRDGHRVLGEWELSVEEEMRVRRECIAKAAEQLFEYEGVETALSASA